jgi:uncharacterized protein YwqG
MTEEQAIHALQAADLGPILPEVKKLFLPSIRIRLTPMDGARQLPGASRFGGAPDLPAGAAWPAFKGKPMSFLAQIDLSETAKLDPNQLLPGAGRLLFFYDADQETYGDQPGDREGWQVIFDGAPAAAKTTRFPWSLPKKARFKPCVCAFSQEYTLPQTPAAFLPGVKWADQETAHYEKLLQDWPPGDDRSQPRHRMLGHPDQIQDEMRLQAAMLDLGIDDPGDPRLAKAVEDWVLLLQVDSDDRAGMRWGSAGRLFFWVRRQGIALKDFSRGWMIMQSD